MKTLKCGTLVTVFGHLKNAFINKVNEDGTYQVRWFDTLFNNVKENELTITE